MLQQMFTIHDSKADAYLPPFFLPTDAMAERTFMDCVNSDDHQFGAHPHDYTLFKLGTFDDQTAEVIINRQTLGNGLEFVKSELQTFTPGPADEQTKISNEPPIQRSSGSGNST